MANKVTLVNNKFDRGQKLCKTEPMKNAIQPRTLKTRAKLTGAAEALIADHGYDALRVDEVVKAAGVAKGTFFAHFKDKDALMDLLIGAKIDGLLDDLAQQPVPESTAELIAAMDPMMRFMTCERYVFDVILRHSGAAMSDQIGPIANTFGRHLIVVADWLRDGPFRRDISALLMAEGVQAFLVQVMALHFCAIHSDVDMKDRLQVYLDAWLIPKG